MNPGMIIKLLRTAEGKSQAELARELEVSSAYLSQVERGRRGPSLQFLKDVSRVLRIPLPLLCLDADGEADRRVMKALQGILTDLLMTRLRGEVGREEGEDGQEEESDGS